MLSKRGKRGAIGATMTWVVATIVILFIIFLFLLLSGTIGSLRFFKLEREVEALKFPEQQESLFAIAKGDVGSLIVNEKYDEAEKELLPVLEKIGVDKLLFEEEHGYGYAGWNLFIFKNNEIAKKIKPYELTFVDAGSPNFYLFTKENPEIKLRLYLECDDAACQNFLK